MILFDYKSYYHWFMLGSDSTVACVTPALRSFARTAIIHVTNDTTANCHAAVTGRYHKAPTEFESHFVAVISPPSVSYHSTGPPSVYLCGCPVLRVTDWWCAYYSSPCQMHAQCQPHMHVEAYAFSSSEHADSSSQNMRASLCKFINCSHGHQSPLLQNHCTVNHGFSTCNFTPLQASSRSKTIDEPSQIGSPNAPHQPIRLP